MKKNAFTLVELLIVVAIIGVMATFALINFRAPSEKARDSKRKSDLRQYQTALEAYATGHNNLYVPSTGTMSAQALCTTLGVPGCTEDVYHNADSSYGYYYSSNAGGTVYSLWSKLEDTEEYYVLCSNGAAGTVNQSSWSNPVSGSCPL